MQGIKKINGKKFYSLYDIVQADLFETKQDTINKIKNRSMSIIRTDKMTNDYLQVSMVPDKGKRGLKYAILGKNIIKYLVIKDDQKSKTKVSNTKSSKRK